MVLSLTSGKPKTSETFVLPSGKVVVIPKAEVLFSLWKGDAVKDSYGNKHILEYDGRPLFAELVVLNTLKKEGWDGVWVDSYRKCFRTKMPEGAKENHELPEIPAKFFKTITARTDFKGCWDVFLWKGDNFLFVECKRKNKDSIRDSQFIWLEACLEVGLGPDNFLLVEWDIS